MDWRPASPAGSSLPTAVATAANEVQPAAAGEVHGLGVQAETDAVVVRDQPAPPGTSLAVELIAVSRLRVVFPRIAPFVSQVASADEELLDAVAVKVFPERSVGA